VKGAREQLLAGTALALEQHGRIGRRRPLQDRDDLRELRILADDLRRAAADGELLPEEQVLHGQAAHAERPLHEEQQVVGIDRLGEEVERAVLHRRHRVLDTPERRHDDHRQVGVGLLGGPQHAQAIAFRQAQIREDDAGPRLFERTDRLGLIARLDDLVTLRLEGVA
jgi:hypothetical protein